MELYVLAILFCFAIVVVSLWFFAKNAFTPSSGLPVSKPISWFSLAGTFVAAQIGGSSILYTAECAYSDGIFAILYPLGSALGLLSLGLGLGARIAKLQISSVPDLFEKHYGSETLKKISSFLSMVSILGLLIAQAIALKDLFRALGIERDTLFISAWIGIVFFTLHGRFKTRSWTVLLQASVLLAVLSAACFFSLQSPSESVSLSCIQNQLIEGFNSKLSAYLLMPCFFIFLEPEMVQSSLQVRSKKEISVAALFSGIVLILCSLIPVFFGIAGKTQGIAESAPGVISTVETYTHPIVSTFCACILLVALISGASTLLWSLNTHLLKDLKPKFFLKFSWGWTLLLAMLALAFSYTNLGVASLILESYELVVVCMLVPLVQAAFAPNDQEYPKLAAALSMCFGAIGFCLCRVISISFFPEAFSILLSWIGFIAGKAISQSRSKINEKPIDCEGLRCSQ